MSASAILNSITLGEVTTTADVNAQANIVIGSIPGQDKITLSQFPQLGGLLDINQPVNIGWDGEQATYAWQIAPDVGISYGLPAGGTYIPFITPNIPGAIGQKVMDLTSIRTINGVYPIEGYTNLTGPAWTPVGDGTFTTVFNDADVTPTACVIANITGGTTADVTNCRLLKTQCGAGTITFLIAGNPATPASFQISFLLCANS